MIWWWKGGSMFKYFGLGNKSTELGFEIISQFLTMAIIYALPAPARPTTTRDRLGPMTVQVASGGKAERMVFGFDAPGPSGGLGKGMGTAVARTSAMKKPLDIAGMKEDMNIVLSSKNKDGVDDDDSDSCSTAELSVLMGRVYDDRTNEGAKGVTVYLVDIASKNPTKESVRTDADGHYTFADIRPSTYVIRIAEMSMSMYGPVYDDGASKVPANNLSTQKIVAVCNGDEYPGVDFGYHRLEEDVYSLLFFARDPDMIRAALAYLFVFVVFCVQVSLLTLMLIDIQFYSLGRWSWSNSLPHITIPVYASRALVCIVAAVFQSALIALTRDLFSGYGAVFPHRTVIKRMDNILFVLVCSSRFAVKAREHEYLKIGGRAMFMRRLEFVFILSAMPGMWGWTKFLEALNRKVLSYPFDDNRYESIFDVTPTEDHLISSTVTTSTTTSTTSTSTTTSTKPPTTTDYEDIEDSTKEIVALMNEIKKSNRGVQKMQKDHQRRVEKIRDDVVSALAYESLDDARSLRTKIDSIIAEKDSELERQRDASARQLETLQESVAGMHAKLRAAQVEYRKEVEGVRVEGAARLAEVEEEYTRVGKEEVEAVLEKKKREMEGLRVASEEALRTSTVASDGEIARLRGMAKSAEEGLRVLRASHAVEVGRLEESVVKAERDVANGNAGSVAVRKETGVALEGKKKELEALKSSSSEDLRRQRPTFEKEMEKQLKKVEEGSVEIRKMRADHEHKLKEVEEKAALALTAALDETSRSYGKKIDLLTAEKEKKIQELTAATEEAVRREKKASDKELAALQAKLKAAGIKLQSAQAEHESKIHRLQNTASSALKMSSGDKSKSLKDAIASVVKEKNDELEEIRSASRTALLQTEAASKKQTAILSSQISHAHDELKTVRTQHAAAIKTLAKNAASAMTAASEENSRILREKIDAVLAKKDTEIKELRSASEEALRSSKATLTEEIVLLRGAVADAEENARSVRVAHASEVKSLRAEASVGLTAAEEKSARLLREKIGAVVAEKKKELEEHEP